MKTLFIEAKSKTLMNKRVLEGIQLPKSILIAYSIQFKEQADYIRKILSYTHNILGVIQVLGCSKPKIPKNTQAILLIGSGQFHAVSLAKETNLPIYILGGDSIKRISKEDIENFEKRKKVSYLKFLSADKVGILISTKSGQQNLLRALQIKNKIKDKTSYLFISNEISVSEFENFPDIKSWVNTACPRLDMADNRIINVNYLREAS